MMTNDYSVEVAAAGSQGFEREAPLHAMWGEAIAPGFTAIPNVLLVYFRLLHVTPLEFLVLLNILAHWWAASEKPYPRVSTLAKRCDASTRSVQRALLRLRALGLLDWERVRVSSDGKVRSSSQLEAGVLRRRYDLTRLVEKAKMLAADRMANRDPPTEGRQIAA